MSGKDRESSLFVQLLFNCCSTVCSRTLVAKERFLALGRQHLCLWPREAGGEARLSPPRPSFDPRLSWPELVAAESGESLPPGYMFALRPHVLNRPQIIECSEVSWTFPVCVVARPIRLPDDCPGSFQNFKWA